MIPRIIHYVWLSADEKPALIQKCIDSWQKTMPDFKIICWNQSRFDINSVRFVKEACSVKKWAFACDYIRLHALYTEGGIYLDSDVLVKKSLEPYLENDFFTAVEYHPTIFKHKNSRFLLDENGRKVDASSVISGMGLQAAIMGSKAGHSYLQKCMNYYKDKNFINADGGFHDQIIAPAIFAISAEKYGFLYFDKLQHLQEKMLILPSNVFASTPNLANRKSIAIHCCAGSWRERNHITIAMKIAYKLKLILSRIFSKFH